MADCFSCRVFVHSDLLWLLHCTASVVPDLCCVCWTDRLHLPVHERLQQTGSRVSVLLSAQWFYQKCCRPGVSDQFCPYRLFACLWILIISGFMRVSGTAWHQRVSVMWNKFREKNKVWQKETKKEAQTQQRSCGAYWLNMIREVLCEEQIHESQCVSDTGHCTVLYNTITKAFVTCSSAWSVHQ